MKYILITMMCWLFAGCDIYQPFFVVKSKRLLAKGDAECSFKIKTKTILSDKTIELFYLPCDCFDVGDTIQFTKVSAKDSIR